MASQIKFFEKNRIDLSNMNGSITVTDAIATNTGQDFVGFMRNRNNTSAWLTTGSTDAANTTLIIDFGSEVELSDIMILKHNLKAYTLKYWNGLSYVDFSTPIAETVNASENTNHEFTMVSTVRLQLIITGTIVADADKVIRQFIATNKLLSGQLDGWPQITNPRFNTNKKISKMLSGKVNVVESVGGFSMTFSVANWNIDADLSLVEEIYFGKRGVLVLLSGHDESQFSSERMGFRNEDIYFMRAINDYTPAWNNGIYVNGLKLSVKMSEAIE